MKQNQIIATPTGVMNYSVQLRLFGTTDRRSEVHYFTESSITNAWKRVKEIFQSDDPVNKPISITGYKQGNNPQYSFANTYSREWYYVLHWWQPKETTKQSREERAYSQPLNQNTQTAGKVLDAYIAENKPTDEEPF